MILTENNLLRSLRERLRRASKVDVAVAWAGNCTALDSLLDFSSKSESEIRIVVGIYGSATHPSALRRLDAIQSLRITHTERLFHPKLYLFHEPNQCIAWIGSANLTRGGFEQNQELVSEFIDDGAAAAWFDRLWNQCDEDYAALLTTYCDNWKPPSFEPSVNITPKPTGAIVTIPDTLHMSWADFVSALMDANEYWNSELGYTVTGEFRSWLSTIELGHALMRRSSWDELSEYEYRLLMGIEQEESGYGLLGSMAGAGSARNVFRVSTPENLNIRRSIRKELQSVLDSTSEQFADTAANFIRAVSEHSGFAGAIATRLMTLARPDRAVSVNRGSQQKISTFLDLPATSLAKPSGYKALITALSQLSWYSSPMPGSPFEALLASNRAALMDALVYEIQ